MAEVVVIGGGLIGQCTAMLLARDGHRSTVLERDPAPPATSPDDAWASWERRGVNQFRMLHYFLPCFREIVERELPEVVGELDANGALRTNPLAGMPASLSGGTRDGDERFTALTGRRPMVESAVSRVAAGTPGVEVRRGAAVAGLLTGERGRDGIPHVVGVVTEDGRELRSDLVVDASGRRSALPRLLADAGAREPLEERDDSGFVYFGRHFRSDDGSVPPALGPPLQHYDSISMLTLPADNGTWAVGVIASSQDPAMRPVRAAEVWSRVVAAYPLVAHWADGAPISDVAVMAKIEDRLRTLVVEGVPVATGVVAVADAWGCTNPSVGRGVSMGLRHAMVLRATLARVPLDDPVAFATEWHAASSAEVEPYFRETVAFDRHRLAEIAAQIEGVPYETDDPAWRLRQALGTAAAEDPDLLRCRLEVASLLALEDDVCRRPGVAERALALGRDPEAPPGPSREELLALVSG